MRTCMITFFLFAALGLAGQHAGASDDTCGQTCCDQCGCPAACLQKTCQVVCEVKKEKKTCWCVECSEICPLMPGRRDCCSECPPPPRCGDPKCVKKLVKKEYQVEVPVYKCVVRHVCPDCFSGGSTNSAPSAAPNPPAAATAPGVPPLPSAPSPPARVPR